MERQLRKTKPQKKNNSITEVNSFQHISQVANITMGFFWALLVRTQHGVVWDDLMMKTFFYEGQAQPFDLFLNRKTKSQFKYIKHLFSLNWLGS